MIGSAVLRVVVHPHFPVGLSCSPFILGGDMAKNRMINTEYWEDDYIHALDPSEKLLFIYCLTSPKSHICGCYREPIHFISYNTGLTVETIKLIFDRFQRDNKILYQEGWICIKNFIRHQKINVNQRTGIENELKLLPIELKEWLLETRQQRELDNKTIKGELHD